MSPWGPGVLGVILGCDRIVAIALLPNPAALCNGCAMGRRSWSPFAQDSALLVLDALPPGGPTDASLHVDEEAICPRCMWWIGPADFVRRTAYGLLQHEACPWRSAAAPATVDQPIVP